MHTPVAKVYDEIYYKYPFLKNVKFNLIIKGKVLDKTQTIGFYTSQSFEVTTDIPDYVFGSDGIVKTMKTNGSWEYDQVMIDFLKIEMMDFINSYGKSNKAMTAGVLRHLQSHYPEKSDEYKLIYRKAERFIAK
jgi:hypothetical protein